MLDSFDDWKRPKRHEDVRESDVENPSKAKARAAGWYVRKYKSPGNRSAPDDLFAKHGCIFFVEFKAPGKEPTEKQLEEHALMRAAGLRVYVCDNRALFAQILAAEEKRAAEFAWLYEGLNE